MADTKTSALTAASTPDGTEVLPVVQGGTTKKATISQVLGSTGTPRHGLATLTARWGVPGSAFAAASGSLTMTLDKIYYEPFLVLSPITVSAIGIEITGAAAGGSTARINIYSANTAWQPVTRMIADGTVAIDAGAMVQRSSLALALTPGLYLAAYTGQATASIRGVPMIGVDMGSNTDVWSTHIDRPEVAAAYAALPASGTAWTTSVLSTTIGINHGVWMKWTS